MGFFKLPIFHVYKEMIHLLTEKHQGTLPNGPKDAYMSRVYVHMLISVCVYVNLIMYLNYVSQKKTWITHGENTFYYLYTRNFNIYIIILAHIQDLERSSREFGVVFLARS